MIRNRSMQELQKFYQKPIAKVSTELIITIVAVMFLALAAIGPTLTTMSQLLKDIADRKTTDQALTKKIAALSTVSNEVLALQKDLAVLDLTIPNTSDIDGLLRRIEKIAAEHKLVVFREKLFPEIRRQNNQLSPRNNRRQRHRLQRN